MLELVINGKVYPFHFGMGFMREINKKIGVPVDGLPNVKKHVGLQYYATLLIDEDVEALVEVLDAANKGQKTRVTKELLDSYIDSPETDIDALFGEVLDFLKSSNATKKAMKNLAELLEEPQTEATEQQN